jgi:hypothetical protein
MSSIEINESEFYSKNSNMPKNNGEHTSIEGCTINTNVSCVNCKHYKAEYFDYSNFIIPEECKHPENIHYTYDYKGRHSHRIWKPYEKNRTLDCEFWEEKQTVYQKIMVRLGIA